MCSNHLIPLLFSCCMFFHNRKGGGRVARIATNEQLVGWPGILASWLPEGRNIPRAEVFSTGQITCSADSGFV